MKQYINFSLLVQIAIILDGIIVHIQGYLIQDYNYVIIGLSIVGLNIVVIITQYYFTNPHWLKIMFIILTTVQLTCAHLIYSKWLLFAGLQIMCIMFQQINIFNAFVILIVQIVFVSMQNSDFIIIGVLRSILNSALIGTLLYQKEKNQYILLANILKHIQHDEFCILNSLYEPIFGEECFHILAEQTITTQFEIKNSITKLITPRDNTSFLQINHSQEDYGKQTMLLKEIIHYFKAKRILRQKKICYEMTNQPNFLLIIESLENNTILITKCKIQEIKESNNDSMQTMIKTLHKVSHDLRNPLNAIINMQTCLRDQIDPSLVIKYLKPSLNSCHLLLNLINDILDSAQVNNQKLKLDFRQFNLMKLIDKTISLFDLIRDKKELKIILDYADDLPTRIVSDKLRIRQIVMNLLSNAIKYSRLKGQILIECSKCKQQENMILISVKDTGLGIKEEDIKHLFQEFSKVENADHKLNPMGIGLGLMISNELAKKLGNGIKVQSQYGVGSTFYFEVYDQIQPQEDMLDSQTLLPQTEVPQQNFRFIRGISQNQKSPTVSLAIPMFESSRRMPLKKSNFALNFMTSSLNYQSTLRFKKEEKNNTRRGSMQGKQIQNLIQKWQERTRLEPPVLIVDDNEFNIMVLQYLLDSLGVQSDSAMSGPNSIDKFLDRLKQGVSYQLVFMDIEMPVMDGFETAQKLLQIDSAVSIVACSGHKITEELNEQINSKGLISAVEKPVSKMQLKQLLVKLADGIRYESQQLSYRL